jgi:hypothetical protein
MSNISLERASWIILKGFAVERKKTITRFDECYTKQ